MSSTLKPRRVGWAGIMAASCASAAAVSAMARLPSSRLQAPHAIPHEYSRLKLSHPEATAPTTLKRSRDDEGDNDRPTKQACRDSAVEAQIARTQELLRSRPKSVRAHMPALYKHSKATVTGKITRLDQEQKSDIAAARPFVEKQQVLKEATPAVSDRKSARDCGLPPPRKQLSGGHKPASKHKRSQSETTTLMRDNIAAAAPSASGSSSTRAIAGADYPAVHSGVHEPEQPSPGGDKMEAMSRKIDQLANTLESQREIIRSKSAQVLRLITANSDQKYESQKTIANVTAQLEEKNSALKQKTQECTNREAEKEIMKSNKDVTIKKLEEQLNQLQRENAETIAMVDNLQSEVKILQDRNSYLDRSTKAAAANELETANTNADLRTQLAGANTAKAQAVREMEEAKANAKDAESNAKNWKAMSRALTQALYAGGAGVSKMYDLLNADKETDPDALDSPTEQIDWRDYVTSAPMPAQKVVSSETSITPTKVFFGKRDDRPLFGNGDPSQGPSSFVVPTAPRFEQPSDIHLAKQASTQQASDKKLDDIERSMRQLTRDVQDTRKEARDMQAWVAKKESGEHALPPPNINQRAFERYIDELVTDKVTNGMAASSGEVVRTYDGEFDTGMHDATPTAFDAMTSAYVDFANAKTFGPDGWPMQTDDNAYHKSVSRQNNKNIGAGSNGKHDRHNGDNGHGGRLRHDNAAGRREGLDVHMGHNDVPDNSRKEGIFSKKRKFEGDHIESNNKRGGKQNNSRGDNHRQRGRHGRNTDHGHGKGGHDDNDNSSGWHAGNATYGGRGGRGRGGHRGRRGRGRGGDHSHTVAGAEDPYAADVEDSSADDGGGSHAGGALEDNMDGDFIKLGRYITPKTVQDVARSRAENVAIEAKWAALQAGDEEMNFPEQDEKDLDQAETPGPGSRDVDMEVLDTHLSGSRIASSRGWNQDRTNSQDMSSRGTTRQGVNFRGASSRRSDTHSINLHGMRPGGINSRRTGPPTINIPRVNLPVHDARTVLPSGPKSLYKPSNFGKRAGIDSFGPYSPRASLYGRSIELRQTTRPLNISASDGGSLDSSLQAIIDEPRKPDRFAEERAMNDQRRRESRPSRRS